MAKIREYLNESIDWQKFQRMLDKHDWYYNMSDDFRYYQKGSKERDEIMKFINSLSGEEKEKARYLYLKTMVERNMSLTVDAQIEYRKLKDKYNDVIFN